MNSLSFPDINVWFALVVGEHQHHRPALSWWNSNGSATIGMSRLAQLGLLRLLTTAAPMQGKPLTMQKAWSVYLTLFEDTRVAFFPEPAALEHEFRSLTRTTQSSPKAWADAFLLAFARCHSGELVTFDQAFAQHPNCRVLPPPTSNP